MKKLYVLFAILMAVAMLTACTAPTAAPTTAPTIAPAASTEPVLTITGVSQTKNLTLDDLKKLPAVEGQAGIKSSTGKITPPTLFKGVLLTELLKQVDGADSTMGVQVEAKDGYAMTLSFDQISKGDFIAYDPATGDETKNAGTLQAILAYEMDGKALDVEKDGYLRLMVISEKNNQVVDGHWSVKFVTKMTLKPLAAEWSLVLQGAINDEVDRGTFESCSTSKCHQASWKDDKAQTWVGTPLYLLVGRVDDEQKHEDDAFNETLADQGYTVEIIAKDGFSVTLDSARVKNNKNLIVAYLMNDNPLTDKNFPLKLVGSDVQKGEGVGQIEKIIIHLTPKVEPTATPEPTKAPEPTAAPVAGNAALSITGLVDKVQAWSMDDLNKMEVVKLTVEHPKKGQQEAEGVRLNALLDLAGVKPDAKTLVITAADGFTATLDLAAVRACADCLIAFNNSGELKSVMPGFDGSAWVKAVVSIEIK